MTPTYGTVENVAAIEREGIRAYVPLSEVGQRAELFGDRDFRYDADADVYRCPGEEVLRFLSQSDATQRRIYQASAADCRTARSAPRRDLPRPKGSASAFPVTASLWRGQQHRLRS